MMTPVRAPQKEIRRFDIFAEWNRLKAWKSLGFRRETEAQSYGLAVAKVVAARVLHGYKPKEFRELKTKLTKLRDRKEVPETWWYRLAPSGEFKKKIIERMGRDFYKQEFQPTIEEMWKNGNSYMDIRDSLRQKWNLRLRSPAK